jgi:polyisoprenoid-binding protein YceI
MRGLTGVARLLGAVLAIVCLQAAADGAEPSRWVPVPGKSQVAFDAKFTLGDFSGRAEGPDGEFTIDPTDLRQAIKGTVRVGVATLRTGVSGRDSDMRKALDAERFPQIRYTVESVEASFSSVTDKADVLLTIRGQMVIRDVERPLVLLGRARLRDGDLWVRGDGTLKMSEFGITPPKRLFLAVGDQVIVSFDLTLSTAP